MDTGCRGKFPENRGLPRWANSAPEAGRGEHPARVGVSRRAYQGAWADRRSARHRHTGNRRRRRRRPPRVRLPLRCSGTVRRSRVGAIRDGPDLRRSALPADRLQDLDHRTTRALTAVDLEHVDLVQAGHRPIRIDTVEQVGQQESCRPIIIRGDDQHVRGAREKVAEGILAESGTRCRLLDRPDRLECQLGGVGSEPSRMVRWCRHVNLDPAMPSLRRRKSPVHPNLRTVSAFPASWSRNISARVSGCSSRSLSGPAGRLARTNTARSEIVRKRRFRIGGEEGRDQQRPRKDRANDSFAHHSGGENSKAVSGIAGSSSGAILIVLRTGSGM